MAGLPLCTNIKRSLRLGATVCLVALVCFSQFLRPTISAAQLGNRSITISTSQPSVLAIHTFTFNTVTAGNIGSIAFEYCINSPIVNSACVPPPGLSVLTAAINSQSGATGFSIDASTSAHRLVITRPVAAVSPSVLSFAFGNITNPSVINQSIYVRISTYTSTDGTGPNTDQGAVVFDLTTGIGVGGYVPPWLVLCVGAAVALNCSNQTHDIQDLGILSSRNTGLTTTQFSIGTNDPGGYSVYIYGPTLASGNNVIPVVSAPHISLRGTGQFGLNLVANGFPAVGANPGGVGTGVIAPGYNAANLFKFGSGDLIASSGSSTDFNLFTVSYIANVDQAQAPGIYSTTLTYIGTAAF